MKARQEEEETERLSWETEGREEIARPTQNRRQSAFLGSWVARGSFISCSLLGGTTQVPLHPYQVDLLQR